MLLSQFIRQNSAALEALYSAPEAHSLVVRLCIERLGVKSYTHIIEPGYELDETELTQDMQRLLRAEPLQYVLGYEEFCGRRFRLTPDVLIPRPETEELVELVLKNAPKTARVLDLCTGSGCIAWSVALSCQEAELLAVDISKGALDCARKQFEAQLSEDIKRPQFIEADVLAEDLPLEGQFDVIVSNPPYVMMSEKAQMRANVLDYEPGLALFVEDSDPLIFYRAIARHSRRLLREGGVGIVEINEHLADSTQAVFRDAGYKETYILRDFRGNYRFIIFR